MPPAAQPPDPSGQAHEKPLGLEVLPGIRGSDEVAHARDSVVAREGEGDHRGGLHERLDFRVKRFVGNVGIMPAREAEPARGHKIRKMGCLIVMDPGYVAHRERTSSTFHHTQAHAGFRGRDLWHDICWNYFEKSLSRS